MDPNDASLTCAVNIEWNNSQGTTMRKFANKQATLRLIRNALKEMFIEITAEKHTPMQLKLRSFNVHSKFMAEGKASVKFNDEKCTLFLSNAPPGLLVQFLKVIYIKVTNGAGGNTSAGPVNKEDLLKKSRAQMLAGKAVNQFDEISPVTTGEMMRARKAALGTGSVTTPSPRLKRKRMSDDSVGGKERPAAKKLYAEAGDGANGQVDALAEQKLNEQQKRVLAACQSGRSIFFTGSAGTGKSFLLRKIIATLPPDGTVATASTGVAACLIGGTTLHSFAGIGSGEATLQNCFEKASRANTAMIWRKCKRLVIDEISMVDADYFEKIEAVARYIRKNEKPFGGIQLIVCGDFFQLPPIERLEYRGKGGQYSQDNDVGPRVRFCFESKVWSECIQASYELTVVHRQKDQEFVGILNSIRIGRVTDEITERLRKTAAQRIETEGILATQLCSHTSEVDAINRAKLEALHTEAKTFDAKDSDPYSAKQLDQAVQAPAKLTLKIGAQVMLLKNYNIAEGLVNGARGVILNFVQGLPLVKFKRRELLVRSEKWSVKTASGMVLTRTQLPLKLAWAFSIHKSQGLTLDCVELSLAKVFEAGQAYVALSRAQSLESIRVLDFDLKQVWANPKVLEYYRSLRKQIANENLMMPVAIKAKPGQKGGTNLKKSLSALGLSKAAMNKPLMTIK